MLLIQHKIKKNKLNMKMPISEIIDRYTITKLKSERTNEDVNEELICYTKELDKYNQNLGKHIDLMYNINGKIWDTESDIRKGVQLPLEEIGRLALIVRDLNCERNAIKADIVDLYSEGFKEIKINYKKIQYGRS
tara:strand:- start:440 stop:844 length:405 start_codon:yes stop_codon:yes gene_type:complete